MGKREEKKLTTAVLYMTEKLNYPPFWNPKPTSDITITSLPVELATATSEAEIIGLRLLIPVNPMDLRTKFRQLLCLFGEENKVPGRLNHCQRSDPHFVQFDGEMLFGEQKFRIVGFFDTTETSSQHRLTGHRGCLRIED